MIVIRVEKKEDSSRINEVVYKAFGQDHEVKLVEEIKKSAEFIPQLSLVAIEENRIVGHILFSKVYLVTQKGEIETIALAPMAVMPEDQRKGIGSMLVAEGLLRVKKEGYSHIIVLGHPDFYPRFGFKKASAYGIDPPFNVPDEVFMAIELTEGSLFNKEGKVRYPKAFSAV